MKSHCPNCSDALIKDKTRLRVDLQDIKLFDGELGTCMQKAPAEYLPLVRCRNKLANELSAPKANN